MIAPYRLYNTIIIIPAYVDIIRHGNVVVQKYKHVIEYTYYVYIIYNKYRLHSQCQ